jgi:hypothetical protein
MEIKNTQNFAEFRPYNSAAGYVSSGFRYEENRKYVILGYYARLLTHSKQHSPS